MEPAGTDSYMFDEEEEMDGYTITKKKRARGTQHVAIYISEDEVVALRKLSEVTGHSMAEIGRRALGLFMKNVRIEEEDNG